MPFRMLRTAGAALALTWGLAAASQADEWVVTATLSPTSALQSGRLCYTNGRDLACHDNNGSVLTTSATLQATRFVGDGSGLTNLQGASADRIVSGTTGMLAMGDTGFVSLTQAGTNTGWFDPTRGLVTLGVSSTGPISGTTGYFSGNVSTARVFANRIDLTDNTTNPDYRLFLAYTSGYWQLRAYNSGQRMGLSLNDTFYIPAGVNNVSIARGITAPNATLDVGGFIRISSTTIACDSIRKGSLRYTDTDGDFSFCRDGSNWENLSDLTGGSDRIVSGTTSLVAVSNTRYISLTQAGTNTGWFDPTRGLVTLGVSATGTISASNLAVRGAIDITTGTNSILLGTYAGDLAVKDHLIAIGFAAERVAELRPETAEAWQGSLARVDRA